MGPGDRCGIILWHYRLAWVFTYTGEIDGFADAYRIGVDLYTGEFLSVDVAR